MGWQGQIGDCWFISALAAAVHADANLIKNRVVAVALTLTCCVVLKSICAQSCPELGYYVFSFFKNDKWVEVLVDDRLLVVEPPGRSLPPFYCITFH